ERTDDRHLSEAGRVGVRKLRKVPRPIRSRYQIRNGTRRAARRRRRHAFGRDYRIVVWGRFRARRRGAEPAARRPVVSVRAFDRRYRPAIACPRARRDDRQRVQPWREGGTESPVDPPTRHSRCGHCRNRGSAVMLLTGFTALGWRSLPFRDLTPVLGKTLLAAGAMFLCISYAFSYYGASNLFVVVCAALITYAVVLLAAKILDDSEWTAVRGVIPFRS